MRSLVAVLKKVCNQYGNAAKHLHLLRISFTCELNRCHSSIIPKGPSGLLESVVPPAMEGRKAFGRQRFPYNLTKGTRHSVMWYLGGKPDDLSSATVRLRECYAVRHALLFDLDFLTSRCSFHVPAQTFILCIPSLFFCSYFRQVTADIRKSIATWLGPSASAEFVWYENPKMSVPDIWHVQVFWRRLY